MTLAPPQPPSPGTTALSASVTDLQSRLGRIEELMQDVVEAVRSDSESSPGHHPAPSPSASPDKTAPAVSSEPDQPPIEELRSQALSVMDRLVHSTRGTLAELKSKEMTESVQHGILSVQETLQSYESMRKRILVTQDCAELAGVVRRHRGEK